MALEHLRDSFYLDRRSDGAQNIHNDGYPDHPSLMAFQAPTHTHGIKAYRYSYLPYVLENFSLCHHGLSRSRLPAGVHPLHQHVSIYVSMDDPCRLPRYQISRAVSRQCEVALATTTCHEKFANHCQPALSQCNFRPEVLHDK